MCYNLIMARTQSIVTPDELKNLESKALEKRDRFYLGVVQGHKKEPSKAQKRLLKRPSVVNSPIEGRGSLFRYLAPLWRELTPAQKLVWSDAGVYSSLTNWQLFISDNAARIRNSLTLSVPPSELWQVRAGYVVINDPADEIILKQEHPLDYWVARKIVGKSWKYELVFLKETFSLPITISIRYKSNLSAFGSTQSARYYAVVWSSYQGQDIYTTIELNFNPSTDWELLTTDLTSVRGYIVGYTLFFEIKGYRGTILFDNIRAYHSGSNWARDPRCDQINKTFQKAFALVPPFWIPVSLPAGAEFYSVYPPSLA